MSKELFIQNVSAVPVAAAGNTRPGDIADGEIAAFDTDDYASGTLDLTAATSADRVQFVQGTPSDDDQLSTIIEVDKVEEVTSKAYTAHTAQVTTVTAETGTGFATLKVIQLDEGFRPFKRISVEVELDGKTASEIATEFADGINESDLDFVTATTSTADIILTAEDESSFETALDGEASDWTVAATTTPVFGSGSSTHVKNIEERAWGGNYPNRIYLPITPKSYVVDGETYDLFTVRVRTNTTANISSSNKYREVIIAIPATATGIDLNTFFGV